MSLFYETNLEIFHILQFNILYNHNIYMKSLIQFSINVWLLSNFDKVLSKLE